MKDEFDHQKLLQLVASQFPLGRYSVHGPTHWRRVEQIGLRIAEKSGADATVVRLFSLFHDSCRFNEGHDPKHGTRGANLAGTMRGVHFQLDDVSFEKLQFACIHHTDGRLSNDVTIGTCWDADRLDLLRVGVIPVRGLLSTAAAKEQELLEWALSFHLK